MKKKCIVAIIVVLCILSIDISAVVAQVNGQAEALHDLNSIYVFVEINCDDPSFERDGLTKSQMKTKIELRLRQAGIQVASEFLGSDKQLILSITAVEAKEYSYACYMEFGVFTLVVSMRKVYANINEQIAIAEFLCKALTDSTFQWLRTRLFDGYESEDFVPGMVWRLSTLLVTGKSKLERKERSEIETAMDMFINDWLTANPKE